MEIEIDFSSISSLELMHEKLQEVFGFPDFYGKNVNALIDCLTSIRYPEDGMTKVILENDERLILTIKSFPLKDEKMLNHLLISIKSVNQRYLNKDQSPPFSICFI